MADRNLLWEEFLANCKKQGLEDDLIKRVFDYLQQNQYLSQGSRAGKQIELRRILEDALGGDQ